MSIFFSRILAILCISCIAQAAPTQENYPSRAIHIVLGFSAGGGTDSVLRAIAQKMSENLGVAVVVENKPGANANIAAESVVTSEADGYTLLYNTSSLITSPALYSDLSYNFRKDLVPIGLAVNVPIVLVVAPKTGYQTIGEFIDGAKAKPGALSYASGGNGNVTHLSAVSFLQAVDISAAHIPYKGETPALADLAGGHVDFYMGTAAGVLQLVKSGKIRALAVASDRRLPELADVPTFSEVGLPSMVIGSWSGLMGPAGISADIVRKLNKSLNDALDTPELLDILKGHSAEIEKGSEDDYASFLDDEAERWGTLIKNQKISFN